MAATNASQGDGDQRRIRGLLQEISGSWLSGKFEALEKLFHDEIVMVRPGFEERAEGREECIRTYRDFASSAVVEKYDETDHQIDICRSTAVATYRFDMTYQMGGREFRETGRDIVVFILDDTRWRVVWRTLVPFSRDMRDRSATV